MVTDSQIEEFVQNGATILDGLLPPSLVDIAEDAIDRHYAEHPTRKTGITEYMTGDGFATLYQHPALEAAAKRILGTDAVNFAHCASLHTLPEDDPQPPEWSYNPDHQHVDIQYNVDEWTQTPRRVMLTFMIFADDVTANRAPTVIRPGSHLQIAKGWGSNPAFQAHPVNLKDLPALDYADPIPLTGRRGQVAASSTAVIHVGSRNTSDRPRKVIFVSFCARGLNLRFNVDREHLRIAFLKEMERRFAPDRRHLVQHTIAGLEAAARADAEKTAAAGDATSK